MPRHEVHAAEYPAQIAGEMVIGSLVLHGESLSPSATNGKPAPRRGVRIRRRAKVLAEERC
jgi:hypothetical protein